MSRIDLRWAGWVAVSLLSIPGCGGPAEPTSPALAAPASGDPVRGAPPSPPERPPQLGPVASAAAPAAAPPEPLRKQAQADFEPARRFAEETELSLYSYHQRFVGNAEGYLAPIISTRDGGFLVVGTRRPPGAYRVGVSQPVVAKLDAGGQKSWEKSYRAPGFLDFEGASALELDDGYVVYILSYVHPARGSTARLVRIDQTGKTLWDTRLRGNGRAGTPHPQEVKLAQGQLLLEGHIYKEDRSETAHGWRGSVSLDGKVLSDEVGAANPYKNK